MPRSNFHQWVDNFSHWDLQINHVHLYDFIYDFSKELPGANWPVCPLKTPFTGHSLSQGKLEFP